MRHAKSSWDKPDRTDHARPLNQRGRDESVRLAQRLSDRGWQPDFVLSSDACRTRETFAHMATIWGPEVQAEFSRGLYLGGYADVVSLLELVPDSVTTLMLLGHNPGWEHLVHVLTGESAVLKTATAVLLTGPQGSWTEVGTARGDWRMVDRLRGREDA